MFTPQDAEAGRFAGRLILRGDPDYEDARIQRIFHSRYPDRFPAAILLAVSESDLIEGVRLARERKWQLGVRSGGHSFPAWGLRDDSLLVDLGNYRELAYDTETEIVSATPSIMGGLELNPFLKRYGRFFGGGACPSVAIGGFLLQGGMGLNFRGWGYAAEQIVAIDLVTAEGTLVRADNEQNTDLYWAARGAGPGFFGLITRFYLKTRPLTKGLVSTMHVYAISHYAKVLEWLWEAQGEISDEVSLFVLAMVPSPSMPLEGHDGGMVLIVRATAHCDQIDDSVRALRPLDGCPLIDSALLVRRATQTSMEQMYEFTHSIHPTKLRYRVDSAWVEGDHRKVIDATSKLVLSRLAEDRGYVFFFFKLPRNEVDMAMTLETSLMIGAYMIYNNKSDDGAFKVWSLDAMAPLNPFTVGQYWGDSDQQHRRVKCLTTENWSRLKEIRRKRDPESVFLPYLSGQNPFDNKNEWDPSPRV